MARIATETALGRILRIGCTFFLTSRTRGVLGMFRIMVARFPRKPVPAPNHPAIVFAPALPAFVRDLYLPLSRMTLRFIWEVHQLSLTQRLRNFSRDSFLRLSC